MFCGTDTFFRLSDVVVRTRNQLDVSGSNRVVSKQPSLGVLFKSQNNRAWTSTPMQDAKFTLYRADFSTSAGNLTLHNTGLDAKRLKPNPITLTNSSTIAIVKHEDHGMYQNTNNVTIAGVESGITTTLNTAITADTNTVVLASATNFPTSGTVFIKIGTEIMSGEISSTTLSSVTRGVDSTTAQVHNAGVTVELYMIQSMPLTEINKTHTAIANIGMNSYTVSLSTNASISGDSTTADVGGVSVTATENYRFELVKPVVSTLELPRTEVTAKLELLLQEVQVVQKVLLSPLLLVQNNKSH